jgi:hypothetical protein
VPADQTQALLLRPKPPDSLTESDAVSHFVAAPELDEWARATFLDPESELYNPSHDHLSAAHIGWLWTDIRNTRQMRDIAGEAEIPSVMGGAWKRGRFEAQMEQWFGAVPDFVITIYAPAAAEMSNREFCALIEHEMLHCGQAVTAYGLPRFNQRGQPVFSMRGHDVEQFVSIMRRYGAVSEVERQFVAAGTQSSLLGDEPIEICCGTCGRGA